eukprot:408115-Pleurochrysis_carterae.AAC.2
MANSAVTRTNRNGRTGKPHQGSLLTCVDCILIGKTLMCYTTDLIWYCARQEAQAMLQLQPQSATSSEFQIIAWPVPRAVRAERGEGNFKTAWPVLLLAVLLVTSVLLKACRMALLGMLWPAQASTESLERIMVSSAFCSCRLSGTAVQGTFSHLSIISKDDGDELQLGLGRNRGDLILLGQTKWLYNDAY